MSHLSSILPNFVGATVLSRRLRLRLLQPLGSGVYGVVYLAHDLASPPDNPICYAVKVLLKHPKGSDQYRCQQREIAYQSAVCDHPNVVNLHRVIEEEHYMYLVMDYCPGGDLFSSIIDRQAFVNNDALLRSTFLQLIDALHSCHDQGVYHRDLKPENILMSSDDRHLYLADFGLATKAKLSSSFGCGSSLYMSPECLGIYAKKAPFCTARSDIWALGVILTNLITGRCPWFVANPHRDEGFAMFLREGPSYIHRRLPISRGVSEILGRIFTLDPNRRITLNELRKAVLEVDTFWRSTGVPTTVPVPFPLPLDLDDPNTEQPHNLDAAPQESDIADCRPSERGESGVHVVVPGRSRTLRVSSSVDANVSAFVNAVPTLSASATALARVDVSPPPTLSTGSSDPESDGPSSPTTQAREPVVDVSNLSLECAGEGCSVSGGEVRMPAPMHEKKKTRSWKRLFHSVHRIRIFA
ncbi:kinase-like domain-containing protein [Sparassis latifolia]